MSDDDRDTIVIVMRLSPDEYARFMDKVLSLAFVSKEQSGDSAEVEMQRIIKAAEAFKKAFLS